MSRARAIENALLAILRARREGEPATSLSRLHAGQAEAALQLPADQVDPDELRMVARLEVHPGDVVVLTSPKKVPPEERERLLAGARAELPAGVRVLLLEEGIGLAILAPSQLKGGSLNPAPAPVASTGPWP